MQDSGDTNIARVYQFQGFRLDLSKHSLYGPDGKLRPLSSRALDTLQLLIEHRGQPLSKAYLLETVWTDTCVEENNLNQAITSIRKALGDTKNQSKFIKTLTGKGYCFVAELEDPAASATTGSSVGPEGKPAAESAHTPDIHGQGGKPGRSVFPTPYAFAFLLVFAGILGAGLYFYSHGPLSSSPGNTGINGSPAVSGKEKPDVIPGSIAVLPFTDLTPGKDNNNDSFALGLHDELINRLGHVNSLKIVSRKKVLDPALQKLTLQDVGRLLHVESVITGTILFSESLARIKLQMLDPETGVIKWAFGYDVDTTRIKDVLDAYTNISLRVSDALQTDIGPGTLSTSLASPTGSFEAYRYNLASRRAFYSGDFEKSLTLSKKALALDPDYLGALYNYSQANYFLSSKPLKGMTTRDHIKLGLESAQRIIDLAPEKHEGYVLKATALGSSGRWEEAMVEVHRLEKMHAPLWDLQLLAPMLMSLGEYHKTMDILQANLQVQPLNGNSRGFLMAAYEAVGNSVQARLEYEMGDELTPDWWGDTVNIFLALGRGENVTDPNELKRFSVEVRTLLSELNDDDRGKIIAQLNSALYKEARTSSVLVHYAAIAAVLGEQDMAVQFMIRATDIVPVHLHWIWLPVFRETWKNPNFKHLLEKAGVLAYWRKHGPPEICQTSPEYFVCNMEGIGN